MKILCPVDRSPRDGTTLRYAKELAKGLGGSMVIVEAVPLVRSIVPSAVHEAEAYVSGVEACLREEGLKAEWAVRKGDPANVIVAVAAEFQADLVVMTTRGRGGVGKAVLGSVTSAVLADCPKPVTLLKEELTGAGDRNEIGIQSAYLATIIWNKRVKGVFTKDEAEEELFRLAKSGLDRNVLYGTYQAYEETGRPVDWLDFHFQLSTLRKFLPEEADAVEAEASDVTSETHAA